MESKGICYIVGAGEFFAKELNIQEGDYVIAADAGFQYLLELGIVPDLLLGDFDSLKTIPEHPHIVRLPAEKDETDMLAAIKTGLAMGYQTFYLYGGTGNRLEHTLANIQCLAYLSNRGARGYLLGQTEVITAITDGSLEFQEKHRGYVSVFAHGAPATGVYLRGLKYPLNNATLYPDDPLGVSNEFLGRESSVTVEKGTLVVVYPQLQEDM